MKKIIDIYIEPGITIALCEDGKAYRLMSNIDKSFGWLLIKEINY